MGLNATLSVVSQREFRKYPKTNPTPALEFELCHGWTPLDLALQSMPSPANLAFRGNRPMVEKFDDDWDAYDAFVTPACVRKINAALMELSDNELIANLKDLGFAQNQTERKEHLAFFLSLKMHTKKRPSKMLICEFSSASLAGRQTI